MKHLNIDLNYSQFKITEHIDERYAIRSAQQPNSKVFWP